MTALFNKKSKSLKETTKKAATILPAVSSETKTNHSGRGLELAMVLIRPHVTEKASDLSGRGVYAFAINNMANKMHVRQAIEKLYKVKPLKVAIVNGKPKYMKNPRTGRLQTKKTAVKKALVYLKKGDKIEFV